MFPAIYIGVDGEENHDVNGGLANAFRDIDEFGIGAPGAYLSVGVDGYSGFIVDPVAPLI